MVVTQTERPTAMAVNDAVCDVIRKEHIGAAARLYVDRFPERVGKLFERESHAVQFYGDLFELMRLAYGQTFFAALHENRLAGYLILTLPGNTLLKSLFRERFLFRAAVRAARGQYGNLFRLLRPVLRSLLANAVGPANREPASPHVYVVAVDRDYAGRGIGSALILRARAACSERYGQMWLYVERPNDGAIRLYRRIGFHTIRSDTAQHLMVWDFGASGEAAR